MDYKEFISYMDAKGTLQKDAISSLQNYVQEFPYFQTAHALLAKAFREQEHVRFDKQLKIAAAYCSDRKSLYALIHHKPASIFIEKVIESPFISPSTVPPVSEESPFIEKPVFQDPEPEVKEKLQDVAASVESFVSNTNENNFDSIFAEEEDPTIQSINKVSGDPRDIIRERLKEILNKKEPEVIDSEKISETKAEEKIISSPEISTAFTGSKSNAEEKSIPGSDEIPENTKLQQVEDIPEVINESFVYQPSIPENSGISSEEIISENKISESSEEEISIADETAKELSTPVQEEPFSETQNEIVQKDLSGKEAEEIIQRIAKEAETRNDEVDKGELEYALESTIIHSLENLPLLDEAKRSKPSSKVAEESTPMSFIDWLRKKSTAGFGTIEEVHAYEQVKEKIPEELTTPVPEIVHEIVESDSTSDDSIIIEQNDNLTDTEILIDKFIAAEPRIVPSKTEFYSPARQAQKSLIEHEDLVSETLAKIYHHQGALLKARSAYQKLILLHPEKKAYFAALIEEIDNSYNNPDKQDL